MKEDRGILYIFAGEHVMLAVHIETMNNDTMSRINRLTALNRFFLEILVAAHLIKEYSGIYGKCRFISILTAACHWILS
jgi:hypothetical protein